MATMTIKSTTVLITEAILRVIPFDSKKLEKGIINEANKIPKRNGFKKGAPKYKIAKANTTKNSILLIFERRCMGDLFIVSFFS